MNTVWDKYLDRQLTNPSVRQAYDVESKALLKPGRVKNQSILLPGPSEDRFVQLRVKAPSARKFAALRGPDPKRSGRNGALVIPGWEGG